MTSKIATPFALFQLLIIFQICVRSSRLYISIFISLETELKGLSQRVTIRTDGLEVSKAGKTEED